MLFSKHAKKLVIGQNVECQYMTIQPKTHISGPYQVCDADLLATLSSFLDNAGNVASITLVSQSFPIRSKFHWTVGPVNLKLLPDQKKFHWTVGGQWSILTL